MRVEAFDLGSRPRHHRLKVDDELFVYRIVGGAEGVQGSRRSPVGYGAWRGVCGCLPRC
jgi:hypothetical protein